MMVHWPAPATLTGLSDHQRAEYAKATRGMLSLLLGRPGTGKTFTLAAIILAIRNTGRSLVVGCPTGKAAVRISETLASQGITDIKATTIHRLLGVEACDGGAWRFKHNEECKLDGVDFILLDECSMIDTPLLTSLLAARPIGCRVLLVGDPGQLSPVGYGAPLRDLIAAGLPCGMLTEIFRNSGAIVRCCKEIAETHTFNPPRALNLDPDVNDNLVWIERSKPEQQIEALKGLLEKIRAKGMYNAVRNVQVVVPVNEKSPLARKTLNKLMQEWLNRDGVGCEGSPFRVDDKIVCLSNGLVPREMGYVDTETEEDESDDGIADPAALDELEGDIEGGTRDKSRLPAHYCANGEQGIVRAVEPGYTVAKLHAPARMVRVPRGQGKNGGNGNGGGSVGSGGGDNQEKTDTGCNWDLSYAISVHKAQGSQWPVVVVMVDDYYGARRLMDRHWIYTAISRPSAVCVCIGRLATARAAVKVSHLWRRKTFLRELVEGLREPK